MAIKILGVDPGSQITGFGVISWESGEMKSIEHGVFDLRKNELFVERLAELSRQLRATLQKHQPQIVVIENIFLGKNTQSAFKLGHARGVIMAEAALNGCQVYEYATRLVKKGVTGTGAAEKDHVRQVLQVLLNLRNINPIDASDALAMAYFHGLEMQKEKLMDRMTET